MSPIRGFASIAERDVSAFESSIGFHLPSDYRQWLLKNNGAILTPEAHFSLPCTQSEIPAIAKVDVFYGLSNGHPYDLRHNLVAYEFSDRVPPWFLAIGENVGRQRICLRLDRDGYGRIYIWAPEVDYEESPTRTMAHLYFVGESFSDFIKGLRQLEDN